jgi:hypothetical protein
LGIFFFLLNPNCINAIADTVRLATDDAARLPCSTTVAFQTSLPIRLECANPSVYAPFKRIG